jgi:DNA-binding transcriptional MerR regulator
MYSFMIKEFQLPPFGPYEATAAGSFSGVKLRTVQTWTDKGLLIAETEGKGDRRKYDALQCIEIGIIATLSEITLPLKIIKKIMDDLRNKGNPLTLKQALGSKRAYIIIRWYKSGNLGVTCVTNRHYGPRSGIDRSDKRTFKEFWIDTTIPEDGQFVKSVIVDLGYIRDEVINKMK